LVTTVRTARSVVEAGRKVLLRHADDFSRRGDERLQAQELLEHAAGSPLDDEDRIDPHVEKRFEDLIGRRTTGEPVAYIRGFEDFRGLRLTVKPGVFIPRQSTEFLAEQAIRRLRGRKDPVAADLATGLGAVALAMAREVPKTRVYATDISPMAQRLARANAKSLGLKNVRILAGSMFDPFPGSLKGSFDVIASHPPYIANGELTELPKELVQFEPITALVGSSEDGLGLIRVLVSGAVEWLKPGGWLCVELAPDLTRKVRPMMLLAGYDRVSITRGISDDSRVLVGRRTRGAP
jgi:release factor glutamine methyltransferase